MSGLAQYKNQAWAPYGIASALDFPVQHGWNGTGQNVAIVIDSDVDRTAVQNYLTAFGITQTGTITTVPVNGASGIATNGDADEAYLDVETVAGLAPGANIYIYQIPAGLSDQDIADAYSKINSDGIAYVVNSSFGGCETPSSPEDPFIAQGTAAGIAYVASGGDNGNVCNTPSSVGATWPASNPNVVGVGGTETNISAGDEVTSNAVWNDMSCQNGSSSAQCAGGGGVSTLYPLPSYQIGVAGESSTSHRNVPDVSLPAEDVAINEGSTSWIELNGTSWSSPEFAALMAEVYQYCQVTTGIANPVNIPYFVESHYQQAYIDVVYGNDRFGATSPYYSAGAGYDNASGFGVPYGMAYANAACPGRVKASGLLARSAMFLTAQPRAYAPDAALDITPRVGGLVDQGRRSDIAATNVQIVLNSERDRSTVETALQQAGFTIDRRYEYRQIVHAQAPAATVEAFFRTELHDVLQPRYGTRYMPVREIALPGSIASSVRTVNIDDVVTRHVLSHRALDWPLSTLN